MHSPFSSCLASLTPEGNKFFLCCFINPICLSKTFLYVFWYWTHNYWLITEKSDEWIQMKALVKHHRAVGTRMVECLFFCRSLWVQLHIIISFIVNIKILSIETWKITLVSSKFLCVYLWCFFCQPAAKLFW